MAHRMPRRVEALKFDCFSNFDNVACAYTAVHIRNTALGILVCDHLCTCSTHDTFVAARVIAVFVRIEDLRNRPAALCCDREAFPVVQWVDGERIAGFGTGDQVVEISVRITGPYLLNDHCLAPASYTNAPPTQVCSTLMSSISELATSK